ncbi:hypothetical protein [Pseudomonas viridiflava]|uniref:hypothetical protein n=1 Tax=Pseudomonas viridiflava TaxID=33069 RepID=UPI000F038419|nr:hypothetical protein [Pseudomonas viridiflava]
MTKYIVEQSKDSPQDWNVLVGEKIEGTYRSLEVANSWAVWFALKALDAWLRHQKNESYTALSQVVNDEVDSLATCIETHILQVTQDAESMSELKSKSVQLGEDYQSMFETAEIVIVLVENSPDLELEPDSVQELKAPETPDKPDGRLKLGRNSTP